MIAGLIKKHFLILLFLYSCLILFCQFALGIFETTNLDYHKNFDTISYLEATKQLLNHFEANSLRCFGYAGFLAPFYYLLGTSKYFFIAVYIVQAILQFISFITIYKLIQFYTSSKLAFFSVLLLMINLSYIVFAFHVMTEAGFLFLIIHAFYCIHLYYVKKKTNYLSLSFLLFCIATLFRPGLLYMTILYGIILLLYYIFDLKKIRSVISILVLFLVTIGFQSYKMHQQFGMYKISFIDDITMYRYLNTTAIAEKTKQETLSLMSQRDSLLTEYLSGISLKDVFKFEHELIKEETSFLIKNETQSFFLAYAKNLLSNFHTGNTFIRDMPEKHCTNIVVRNKIFDITRIVNMLFVVALLLTSIAIFILLILKKIIFNQSIGLAIMLLIYANYLFFTAGVSFYQGDRFNIVWMPMLLVAMVFVINNVFSKK